MANPRTAPDKKLPPEADQTPDRKEDLSKKSGIEDALLDLYKDIEKGWTEQQDRSNKIMDYWDVYNCELTAKQFYTGRSEIFHPVVHNAINARKTRFVNQIFPVSGRYVEVTTEDGTLPYAEMALAEHYVRKARLRTKVMPALVVNGDVEGQYNLYVTWTKNVRHVAWRVQKPLEADDGIEDPDETADDIAEETLIHGYPHVEVLHDGDVLVLPQTADTVEEAIEVGGSATIMRRWTKAKIKKLIKDKEILKEEGELLVEELSKPEDKDKPNTSEKMVDAAGIKGKAGAKYALIYETWTKLTIDGERRICRVYYGGEKQILGCKRNPYWSDHLPLISAPRDKVAGAFKGQSAIKPVASMQYQANDAVNEAMDSAAYAAMPLVMTDPLKNPRIGSMILSPGAIWETNPNDTQFASMPKLWQDGLEIAGVAKAEIFQTLSVNPAMISQTPGKGKQNQAQVAQEQQVEILTTADSVTVIEEAVLTPLLNRMIELDHQFRDDDLLVRQYGELGVQAKMSAIPPVQFNRRYQFRWFGVESARNAQQVQQQIAGMNVLAGIPPDKLNGYQIDLVPIITQLVENQFGPRLAPMIFKSPQQQMPVPIDQENMLLINGFEVPVHVMDDDKAHIQAHAQLMQQAQASENVGAGVVKKIQEHMFQHMQQAQRKAMQAQQQQVAQMQGGGGGAPGRPGGAGPGVAGTPRPGAQPMPPRGGQGPPGMIHQDQLRDPNVMPRKM